MKRIKINSRNLSIQNPGWFYRALDTLQSNIDEIKFDAQAATTTPSGVALIELLKAEAGAKQIKISGLPDTDIRFPYHSKHYSLDWFEGSLKPHFFDDFIHAQSKPISEDDEFDLRLLFSELTQNAQDHSTSERYLVLLSRSEIGVFDLGVSIPSKIEQKYRIQHDLDALELSLKKGVTTRRLRLGGMGLYFTIELVKRNLGYLYLASRNAQLRIFFKNRKIDRKNLKHKMPGTLIYCSLSLKPRKLK